MGQPKVACYTRYSSLCGRRVVITGGASGIGACLVEAFLTQHAQVVFIDIDISRGISLAAAMVEQGLPEPIFINCDVSDIAALQCTLKQVVATYGAIDVLINNAANDERQNSETVSNNDWCNSLAVNLTPYFFAAQAVIEPMKNEQRGVILNISSVVARLGERHIAAYVTAKAGVLGLTQALAAELGEHNIRVNAILPGWVATERQLAKWLTPEREEELYQQMCIKRRLQGSDIAKMALFLASDDAAMITSQEFVVDGGRI